MMLVDHSAFFLESACCKFSLLFFDISVPSSTITHVDYFTSKNGTRQKFIDFSDSACTRRLQESSRGTICNRSNPTLDLYR